jgi:single-strand DNA-binding protein
LNEISLIGNVGNDPEIRETSAGRVATVSLATSEKVGEEERTEWHRCVIWNSKAERGPKLADIIEKYVKKGEKLYVKGKMTYRSYEGTNGEKRTSAEIVVREVILLGGKSDGDGASRPASKPAAKPAAKAASAPAEDAEDPQDLPF